MNKAYKRSKVKIPDKAYLQVLNLFYLCDEHLNSAIKRIKDYDNPIIYETEKKEFPFVWYAWGGDDKVLNKFKARFNNIRSTHHYYNYINQCIVNHAPGLRDHARHPQRLENRYKIELLCQVISGKN